MLTQSDVEEECTVPPTPHEAFDPFMRMGIPASKERRGEVIEVFTAARLRAAKKTPHQILAFANDCDVFPKRRPPPTQFTEHKHVVCFPSFSPLPLFSLSLFLRLFV